MDKNTQSHTEIGENKRPENIPLLKQVAVLSVLSDQDIEKLADKTRVVPYRAGEFIVRQGKLGNSLYVIQAGVCEVFVVDQQGFQTKVAKIDSGDFFGEMSLLTGEPHTATVRALQDSTLVIIDKPLFKTILESSPKLSEALGRILEKRQKELAALTGGTSGSNQGSTNLGARIKSFFKIK